MEFELKLKQQDLQIIINALGARPYTEVFQIINTIQEQYARQIEDSNKQA